MGASFVDRLLDWFLPYFSYWGYLIVFGGVFFESIFLTGWIAPGTTAILLGGFFSSQGGLNAWMVWCTAIAGALLGDNLGYFIGRRLGGEVMEKYGDRPRVMRRMEKSQRFFSRYGGATVVFGRMLSGIDAFIPLTAGMNSMPHWKYMAFDIPGAAVWAGAFTALGYFFGTNWRTIDRLVNYLGWGLLALAAAAAAAFILVSRRRASRA